MRTWRRVLLASILAAAGCGEDADTLGPLTRDGRLAPLLDGMGELHREVSTNDALAPNLNDPAPQEDRERSAYEAVQEARRRAAGATEKDRAMIEALAARYAAGKAAAKDHASRAARDARRAQRPLTARAP